MTTLASAIYDIQTTRFSQLASGSIIIYDYLITLDDEIELIWKSSWSLGKGLFILNRYYAMICVIVNNYGLFNPNPTNSFITGLSIFRWQGWTGLITCMVAQGILQMRLYAMYSLNKKVLAIMLTCFVASTTASAAILGTVLSRITAFAVTLSPTIVACVPFDISPHFFAFWIPILAFESILCGMALFKGYETFRLSSSIFLSGKHLVGILIRDSILYFVVIFAIYFTNLLFWSFARQTLLEVPIGFAVAFSCSMGNRLVFNVREMSTEIQRSRTSEKYHHSLGRSHSVVLSSSSGQISKPSDYEMTQLRSMKAGRF